MGHFAIRQNDVQFAFVHRLALPLPVRRRVSRRPDDRPMPGQPDLRLFVAGEKRNCVRIVLMPAHI